MTLENEVTLIGVGDLLLRRKFIDKMRGDPKYSEFLKILGDADITFGNLEVILCTQGGPTRKPGIVKGDITLVDDLASLGVDVVSLANNHTLDYGYGALFEMLQALDHKGIKHVGAGKNIEEADKEVVVEVQGKKIGFLSFSCSIPEGFAAGLERPGIAPIHVRTAYQVEYPRSIVSRVAQEHSEAPFYQSLLDEPGFPPIIRTFPVVEDVQRVEKRIKDVKGIADFVIVSLHWGIAYYVGATTHDWLCEYQPVLGHAIIDAGADLVFGHHAHRIHAVEVYKKKPILYSVGNCITTPKFPARKPATPQLPDKAKFWNLIIRVKLSKDGVNKIDIVPIIIDKKGCPYIAGGEEKRKIIDYVRGLSSPFETVITYEKDEAAIQAEQ